MKAGTAQVYRCPKTQSTLELSISRSEGDEVIEGELQASGGLSYQIRDGLPYFFEEQANGAQCFVERDEVSYYEAEAASYDAAMDWLFKSFYEDEVNLRRRMIDLLEVGHGARVLETGCGTCRDSKYIAERLGSSGQFFMQDLSSNMVKIGRNRMKSTHQERPTLEYSVGSATQLPFPDEYFDAAYHFGGLNIFPDKGNALKEMARVVRRGGKVVVGDEAIAPWLAERTYGKILQNSNPLYRHSVPLSSLPINAHEVCIRWIIGNAFYLIDFRVERSEPKLDLDLPILGRRGGTHRTRFYGGLEGVSPEAKVMVERAAAQAGTSIHEWLEQTVREKIEQSRQTKP